MFAISQIETLGRRLLESPPNSIVRYRLLRDVLGFPEGHLELSPVRGEMLGHAWVAELAGEQHPDGSWGRFHSQDSRIRGRFPTSEIAIRRALALGLDRNDAILARASRYMVEVLEKRRIWSDRVEKSEGWPTGVEAITAGTLAQVNPISPAVLPAWTYWVEIARRSFPAGEYDPQAEWKAHKDLRGLGIRYLGSRYVLTLLGARSAELPAGLDREIVNWIWDSPQGIGYLGAEMKHPRPFHIFNWLESLEILSRFQCWREVTAGALDWLWDQRIADGLWDFGSRVGKSSYFPLSDDWRKVGSRSMDHSTRVLVLVRRFVDR